MRGRAMNFDADSFPFSHFALRLQRPPGGSLCDIRENAEYFLPLRLNPYAIVVLRAVLVSHPSRAEYLVKVFQEPSLAKTTDERERSDVAEHVAPGIGNLIAQPGSVAEARDRPFVALNRMCRVPDPYSAVALRVSDCLLHSRRSPLCLSFLSEVGLLSLCPRSSAVCVGAFAVRAFFSAGLPLGGPPCIVVSLSPRKGLPITTTPTLHLP